jgi:hypothetical protein
LSEEERERILSRIEAKKFPRSISIGAGLQLAGDAVNEAISEQALGIAG